MADRIVAVNNAHTFAVYANTCRGLFERHKLLFAFDVAVRILRAAKKVGASFICLRWHSQINSDEYDFFIRGGVVIDKDLQPPNPCKWLPEIAWDNITGELSLIDADGGGGTPAKQETPCVS